MSWDYDSTYGDQNRTRLVVAGQDLALAIYNIGLVSVGILSVVEPPNIAFIGDQLLIVLAFVAFFMQMARVMQVLPRFGHWSYMLTAICGTFATIAFLVSYESPAPVAFAISWFSFAGIVAATMAHIAMLGVRKVE